MIHALLIVLVALVLARDAVPGLPLLPALPAWMVVSAALVPLAAIALLTHAAVHWCGRRVDQTGRWRYIHLAEWSLTASRLACVLVQATAILGLGWLDLVRRWLGGNLVLVDEALVTLPPLAVIVIGWSSFYAVDRRLREAAIIRSLDSGRAPRPLPTRAQYVLDQVRHHVLLIVVPIGLIALWSEGLDKGVIALAEGWPWLYSGVGSALVTVVHFAGVLLTLTLMPLVLRIVWSTVALGPGPMRDRLLALCRRQGVRCRDLLVWRTHTGMLNGAVIGIIPWIRYILLTDALLEQLSEAEIEAVMAHEVAHARRHHLPWLMLALLASVGGAWTLALTLLELCAGARSGEGETGGAGPLASGLAMLAALSAGLFVFGFVSRRFEQQADAFAAQHLSGRTRGGEDRRDIVIRADAVAAMAGALGAVALLNHIPPAKFTWRHGSILGRQQRLERLIGLPAHALPIDRLVFWLKLGAALALILVVGVAAWSEWHAGPAPA